jgi:hypothetical protein
MKFKLYFKIDLSDIKANFRQQKAISFIGSLTSIQVVKLQNITPTMVNSRGDKKQDLLLYIKSYLPYDN